MTDRATVTEGEWGDEVWLVELDGRRVVDLADRKKADDVAHRLNVILAAKEEQDVS